MSRMRISALALGLGWMASLGVVFVLGILSAFAFHLKPGAAGTAGDQPIEERELALTIERLSGQAADLAAIHTLGVQGIAPQLEQSLRALLRTADPDLRAHASFSLTRGLPPRQLMAAIRFLQELPPHPHRDEALGRFLQQWGQRDGRSAIAFAINLERAEERELAIAAILKGWSRERPLDAWSWVVERAGTPRRAQPWLEIILLNLQRVDRPRALELLRSLPPSPTQIELAAMVMDGIMETTPPRSAMQWLAELPSEALSEASARLALVWARSEPESATLWLAGSAQLLPYQIHGVLQQWVAVDPQRAANWVWAEFDGEYARQLLETVAHEWIATEGPAPLAEWINQNGPGFAMDGAIEALAMATAPLDPETALVWVQQIRDHTSREMLEVLISSQWADMLPMSEPITEQYYDEAEAEAAPEFHGNEEFGADASESAEPAADDSEQPGQSP